MMKNRCSFLNMYCVQDICDSYSATDDGQGTSGPSHDVPGIGHRKASGTKMPLKRERKGEKKGEERKKIPK